MTVSEEVKGARVPVRLEGVLAQLAAADEATRLEVYASLQVSLSAAEVEQIGSARHEVSGWLCLRFEAGPPGQALPTSEAARRRLLAGAASLADVAGWALLPGGEVAEAEELMALLRAAWTTAMGACAKHWVRRCGRGLAVLRPLVAEPQTALELLNEAAARPEFVYAVKHYHALAEAMSPWLEDPWLRVAAVNYWNNSGTEVPARLDINPWLSAALERGYEELLDALQGTEVTRPLVDSLTDVLAALMGYRLKDHPVTAKLRQIANYGGRVAELEGLAPPEGLEAWMFAAARRDEPEAARLAAWLLYRHGALPGETLRALIGRAVHAEDLPLLAELAAEERAREGLLALARAVEPLTDELADEFVRLFLWGPKYTRGLMRCHVHVDELRRAAPGMVAPFAELAAAILAECDAVDLRMEEGRGPWLEVVAWARGVIEQCGELAIDGEVFESVLDAAVVPALDEHAIAYADRHIEELKPQERLFTAGLVRRRLAPELAGWRGRFDECLIWAAIHSEVIGLFPYAIAVIDGLLARGGGGGGRAAAELLRDKAKLLGAGGRAGRAEAAGLLREAAAAAGSAGLIRCRIHATTELARLVIVGVQLGDEWSEGQMEACVSAVDELAEEARGCGMLPEVYEARGMLARHLEGWAASARWYREALAVSDEQAYPVAAAELHTVLAQSLMSGDGPALAEAERHARAALRLLRGDGGAASRTLAQAVLGMVLVERDEEVNDEAIVMLEDALRTPRALRGLSSDLQPRLCLAEAYRRAGRVEEAATQVRRIFEARAEADVSLLVEAVFIGVHLGQDGGVKEAEKRLLVLLTMYSSGPEHTLLQLVHALLLPEQHELESMLAWASAYVRGELPRIGEVDRALVHLIEREAPRLPGGFLELCLEMKFVPEGCWTAHAKMLLALGHTERLQARIEETLAGQPRPELRRIALFYQLQLLAAADPRGPELLLELEASLGEAPDSPYLRAELARLMFHKANGDAALLARAWRLIEAAAPGIAGDRAAVERLQMAIRGAQLACSREFSGAEQVALARWFDRPLVVSVQEVEAAWASCARQLLWTGPFTCPEGLALACELSSRVRAGVEPLLRRIAWISQEQARPGAGGPVVAEGEQSGSKFDEAPAWVIELVVRGCTERVVVLDEEAFAWVRAAVVARPDRGEVLLGWLARRPVVELTALAERLAGLCIDGDRVMVASTLLAQLELVLREAPNFALRCLQVQLLGASGEWGDGTPYAAAAATLVAAAETEEQRATALFLHGVERLEAGQAWRAEQSGGEDPVIAARRLLVAAVELARSSSLPTTLRFAILVSAGNSHRDGASAEFSAALELYAEARALGAPDEHAHAKLCKVTADALLLRGEDEDGAQIEALLAESLRIRRGGWLRAETLVTAARAALAREERPWVSRLRTASQRLAEAQEHDDGRNRAAIAGFRRHVARRLLAERANDDEATAVLREVAWLAEDREDELAGLQEYSRDDLETAARMMEAPAMLDFHRFAEVLKSVRGYGEPTAQDEVVAAVRASLAELATLAEDTLSAGAWLARAQLSAYLAEQGLAEPAAAKQAAERAEDGLEAIEDPIVRAFLCSELCHLWAPENSWSHPVRDFARAARLAERALEWVPAGQGLHNDLIAYLARATRYRTDGDVRVHMQRAEQLYSGLVGKSRGAQADELAVNLEEVRTALQPGGEVNHLRRSIAAAERAVAGERPTMMQRIALARDRTLLGTRVREPESSALLERAAADWAALPWGSMNHAQFESADNYRAICTAVSCRRGGDLEGALAVWRDRVARLDRRRDPLAWAMAAHNCADTLVCCAAPERMAEAFRLASSALEVRTSEGNLKHHLETCQTLADAGLELIKREAEELVGLLPEVLISRLVGALDSGLAAAETLGGAERRFRLAVRLVEVARAIAAMSLRMATLERAWGHIDAARPFMLGDGEAAEVESGLAVEVASQLAEDLSRQGLTGARAGVRFVFEGERAAQVLRWILRGVGGAQRRLAARARRPAEVALEVWVAWVNAVRGGDEIELARCLERVREQAPEFLSARPDVRGIEHWLHTHDESAAVIVVLTRGGLLTATIEPGMRVKIAMINAPRPPASEQVVAKSMASGDRWSPEYEATLAWAERSVVGPVVGMLSGRPQQLLWCPAGVLGVLAPASLWRGVAVTCVIDPCIRASLAAQVWGHTALLVADPGGELAIRGALEIAERLARRAAELGSLRVRVSRGARFGSAVVPGLPGLVNAPASATGFLEEALAAQLVVLLAHGGFEPPLSASLMFVSARGAEERLDLQKIAEDPRRIADKTFVLLSCETGRSGGLAGALLACGARRVVAPLWPVFDRPAAAVGEAVLAGLAERRETAQVLRELTAAASADGGESVSSCGFVVWSG